MVRVRAFAKLNLTLEIDGVQDGFHMLDSLVTTIDLFDVIRIKKRKDKQIFVAMHGMGSESIPVENNNAQKAGEAFVRRFQTTGADITVYKNIPMGAGLGGSSVDAAGVLNGLAKAYGVQDREGLEELADGLGSDVKYLLDGGYARMQKRGQDLTKIESELPLHFLLVCPKTPISTKTCFSNYDQMPKTLERKESATQNAMQALCNKDINGIGRCLTNDLYLSAVALNEEVKSAYETLQSFSPLGVGMTGSGSAVFALFESKELCLWAKSRYKGKAKTFVVQSQIIKEKNLFRNPFTLRRDGE